MGILFQSLPNGKTYSVFDDKALTRKMSLAEKMADIVATQSKIEYLLGDIIYDFAKLDRAGELRRIIENKGFLSITNKLDLIKKLLKESDTTDNKLYEKPFFDDMESMAKLRNKIGHREISSRYILRKTKKSILTRRSEDYDLFNELYHFEKIESSETNIGTIYNEYSKIANEYGEFYLITEQNATSFLSFLINQNAEKESK